MSQGNPPQLTIGKLRRRLEEEKQLNAMHQEQIKRMKQIITEICEMGNFAPPDLRYGHYVPIGATERYARQDEQEDATENQATGEITQILLSEMVVNSQRKGRRHSIEAKKFFSAVYLQCPKAYKLLQQALPIPTERTLLRFSKELINTICERIMFRRKERIRYDKD